MDIDLYAKLKQKLKTKQRGCLIVTSQRCSVQTQGWDRIIKTLFYQPPTDDDKSFFVDVTTLAPLVASDLNACPNHQDGEFLWKQVAASLGSASWNGSLPIAYQPITIFAKHFRALDGVPIRKYARQVVAHPYQVLSFIFGTIGADCIANSDFWLWDNDRKWYIRADGPSLMSLANQTCPSYKLFRSTDDMLNNANVLWDVIGQNKVLVETDEQMVPQQLIPMHLVMSQQK